MNQWENSVLEDAYTIVHRKNRHANVPALNVNLLDIKKLLLIIIEQLEQLRVSGEDDES